MIESLVRRFLYYPTKVADDAPIPYYVVGAREVRIKADSGDTIHGLYWPAPEGRPTILFLHGNAQTVFEWALVREELAPLDCGLLLIDYPGYGKSTGAPSEIANYAAGRAALDFLLFKENIAEKDIVIFGKSLGGGVATEVAIGLDLRGVVLESTFTSIPSVARLLLPMLPTGSMFQTEVYDSVSKISSIHSPIFVIHGTHDELIPIAEGKALFEKAGPPKQSWWVEGAGHNDVSMTARAEYGRRLRAWLDEVSEL